ncbi:MAG: hypothetical protein JWM28_3909, partial [Chitinophagaceae bacterium]|nr:hypothetical protein [Chitinophagaceae bacterium]
GELPAVFAFHGILVYKNYHGPEGYFYLSRINLSPDVCDAIAFPPLFLLINTFEDR